MKIAIMSEMPIGKYSGGRYHGFIMAECLAYRGHKVSFITNNKPIFYNDFSSYENHKDINMVYTMSFDMTAEEDLDYVIIVPSQNMEKEFYIKCRNYAIYANAKLVLVNFESANWFNMYSPMKRDERTWDRWKEICEQGCLILSSAKESMKYAKKFYVDYPQYTQFDYWYPAINSKVADSIDVRKEKRIVVITRLQDKHKGSDDIFEIINQELLGYTLVFIIGTGEISQEYIAKLDEYKGKYGFDYEIKKRISDEEKFYEIKRSVIMLFPSYFEGYGYPPIEAQYCDCQCLVYDLPVLRETSADGLIYCEYGNPLDMHRKLQQILGTSDKYVDLKSAIYDKGNFAKRAEDIDRILTKYLLEDWRNPKIRKAIKLNDKYCFKDKSERFIKNNIRKILKKGQPILRITEAVYDTDDKKLIVQGWALGMPANTHVRVRVKKKKIVASCAVNQRRADVMLKEEYKKYANENCGWKCEIITSNDVVKLDVEVDVIQQGISIIKEKKIITNRKPELLSVYEGVEYHPELPNVVVISHILLEPSIQGNRVYINQMLDYLMQSKEYNVFLVLQVCKKDAESIIDLMARRVSKIFIADLDEYKNVKNRHRKLSSIDKFYQGTEDTLLYINDKYGIYAAVAQYVHMASNLERLPQNVKKIVVTHDLLYRLKEFEQYGITVEEHRKCTREEEITLLSFADIIVGINSYESKLLKDMLPNKKVITMGFSARTIVHDEDEREGAILFFASGNPLNVRGIERFIEISWKKIKEVCPAAQLRIAGTVCQKITEQLAVREGVILLGILSEQELEKEKLQSQILLNCTDLGTGLKIKSIECLAAGKPFVSTPKGVEGIDYDTDQPPFMVADSWEEFAQIIVHLLKNKEERIKLGEAAMKYTELKLSMKSVYRELRNVLKNVPLERENKEIEMYVNLLMESIPRLKLSGKLGVVITEQLFFSKYVIDYLKRNSLNICGIYSLNKELTDCSYQDIFIQNLIEIKKEDIDLCLIPTGHKKEMIDLDRQLYQKDIRTYNFIAEPTWADRMKILEYKGKHEGEEAFILGNGPSVRYEDLDRLKGKLVFVANRFHKAYENTSMRGTYTASADILMIEEFGQEIARGSQTPYFVQARGAKHVYMNSEYDIIEYGIIPRPVGPFPQVAFSEDLTKGLGNGASIVYDLIQLAVWMGVKRIYLYGIDHSFNLPANYTGKEGTTVKDTGENNHFIKDYRKGSGVWYSPATEVINKGFEVARMYCDSHGVEIYNITRGGYLEAFLRRDFDDVIKGIKLDRGGVSKCIYDTYSSVLLVQGYFLSEKTISEVVVYSGTKCLGCAIRNLYRPDVYEQYKEYDEKNSGWRFEEKIDEIPKEKIKIVVKSGHKVVKEFMTMVDISHKLEEEMNILFKEYEVINGGALPINVGKICEELKEKKLPVRIKKIDYSEYQYWLKRVGYLEKYPEYLKIFKDTLNQKSLQHFLSLKLLNVEDRAGIFLDVASSVSIFPEILCDNYNMKKVYRQDLNYDQGIHGDKIGSFASKIPLPDESVDYMTLHCSIEHFEDGEDVRFLTEAFRLLKKGGAVCIIPLYMADEYIIVTSPSVWHNKYRAYDSMPQLDKRAKILINESRKQRQEKFFDVKTLYEDIYQNYKDKFEIEIAYFENYVEMDGCPVFAMILRKY